MTVSYIGLLIFQPVWHALLPEPFGSGNWILALAATAPLLLPVKGVLQGLLRSMTWAGYLVMLYLVIGIMEAWSNPDQRLAALIQVMLVVIFIASLMVFSRPDREDP